MHASNEVIMPVLGMIQETGKIIKWLIEEGHPVQQGQPLLEVETDKAIEEIEAPASGILSNVKAQAGDDVPVGQVIAVILPAGEALVQPSMLVSTLAQPAQAVTASPLAARMAAEHHLDLEQIRPQSGRIEKAHVLAYITAQNKAGAAPQPSTGWSPRPLASPKARRLAVEGGIDLGKVTGTGPDGAVLAGDVSRFTTAAASEQGPLQPAAVSVSNAPTSLTGFVPHPSEEYAISQDVPISKNWSVMAEHTTQAWTTAPHFYLMREVNASALNAWHNHLQIKYPKQISITDLLVKLVASALIKHPRVNVYWLDGHIRQANEVNIGLAVAFEDGLAAPVIHHADQLGLAAIATERKALVLRTQQGKLRLEDIQGGTFTISNLGMYGIDAFNAVLNSPQAAILAVGRIAQRVVVVNGQPGVQPMLTLTMTYDHRAVDGARGAEFLRTLAELIEEPLSAFD
jgi:pyruvate dehydrogenase E2 component (dihydrolipoamide acetyltransferase)